MRARNRDNARRTRKRKKLYIAFLNNALESLENVLNPKESSSDSNADNLNEKNVNSGSSYLIEASIVDDNNQDSEATSNNKLLDSRFSLIAERLSAENENVKRIALLNSEYRKIQRALEAEKEAAVKRDKEINLLYMQKKQLEVHICIFMCHI